MLSIPNFIFLDAMCKHFTTSVTFQAILQQITLDPGSHPGFELRDGLLLFNNRVWLEPDNPFIKPLLEEFYSTPIGGHLGFAKTLHRVQSNFHWASMRRDVKHFVRHYTTCQQVKYETKCLASLL